MNFKLDLAPVSLKGVINNSLGKLHVRMNKTDKISQTLVPLEFAHFFVTEEKSGRWSKKVEISYIITNKCRFV